jgi:endonuclease/exonuclease/phosphatase family metal-dependent hydrolase
MKNSILFFLFVFAAVCTTANTFSTSFKVGTYNIRFAGASGDTGWKDWSQRKTYVAQTITSYDYDIIGLNECRGAVQLADMQDMLGDTFDFVLYSDLQYPGSYNPILYKKDKFNLLNSGVFFLNANDLTKPFISWDNSGNYRFTVYAKLQVKQTGEILYYFQTHLDHYGETARNEQSRINMEQVRKIAGSYPTIVCGDHNATKSRIPFYNMMLSYMQDSRNVAETKINISSGDGTLSKRTVNGKIVWDPAYKSSSRLDYIWIRGMIASEYRHIDDTFGNAECPSDHIAIQATVTLNDYVAQHTFYVDPAGGDGDGTITNPFNDLQKAIDATTQSGDTIFVKAGKLNIAGSGKNATINVTKTLTIIGGYNNDFSEVTGLTELNGDLNGNDVYENFAISNTSDNLYRLITVNSTCGLEIANFNLHGANAPLASSSGQGAAIYCSGYRLLVDNCWIHNNMSYGNGAGIYCAGALDINKCKMYNNVSSYGAGGAFYSVNFSGELYWRMSVKDSEFYGNKATMGGAGYNGGFSWLGVTGCSFYNNKTTNSGTFYVLRTNYDSNVCFANNTFANNIVEATTISGLSSSSKGGSAIWIKLNGEGSNVALVNNTIVGNYASCYTDNEPSSDFNGAAVQTLSDCTVRLYNNIIAANQSTASTGGDVYLFNTTHVDTQHNVYSCNDNMQLNPSSNDLYMSTYAAAQTAISNILDGDIKEDKFVANFSFEANTPTIKVKDPSYGSKLITFIPNSNFAEYRYIGDVNHNAQIKGDESLTTDQRGLKRRTDGTSCAGAYEYGEGNASGIPEIDIIPGSENLFIYDLSGRIISSPRKIQGVFIQNGKKYLIIK